MYSKPRSPLERPLRWELGPVNHYHVVFWRQPYVAAEKLPKGFTQDQVGWAANENDVLGARDVIEVIQWAEDEARRRNNIFTLYAVIDKGGEGMVWLAGWNPTVHSRENYTDRQPPGVNPTAGPPGEV